MSKRWKNITLYGGLGIAFLAGLAMNIIPPYLERRFRKRQVELFGTVDSPKYLASDGISNQAFFNLDSIGDVIDNNDRILLEWIDLSSKDIGSMEDEYRQISEKVGKEDADRLERLCSNNAAELSAKSLKLSQASMFLTDSDLKIAQLGATLGKQDIKKGESVEDVAKRAFIYTTGKSFPSEVSISSEDIKDRGIAGYHSDFRSLISYEDIQYLSNLKTLLHEMGHAAVQHTETGITFRERSRDAKRKLEVYIIEEACAYSFTDAAAHALSKEDGNVAAVVKILNDYQMRKMQEKLYSGPSNEGDEHYRGAELYIAARHVLKDPSKVFNYLASLEGSSLESVSPEIRAQMQKNRDSWKRKQSAEGQIKLLDGRVIHLIELYDSLRAQIGQYRNEKKEESLIDWGKAFSE